jgi:hypothetical protein
MNPIGRAISGLGLRAGAFHGKIDTWPASPFDALGRTTRLKDLAALRFAKEHTPSSLSPDDLPERIGRPQDLVRTWR